MMTETDFQRTTETDLHRQAEQDRYVTINWNH